LAYYLGLWYNLSSASGGISASPAGDVSGAWGGWPWPLLGTSLHLVSHRRNTLDGGGRSFQ